MVFQNATLFDSMTLAENVALPLRKHKGLRHHQALVEARRRLGQVHMSDFADRYPAELGDGMRKRAAIARTLTLEPEVVLFDEPTTGLDPVNARRIDKLIRELSDEVGRHLDRGVARPHLDLLHRRPDRVPLPGPGPPGRHTG